MAEKDIIRMSIREVKRLKVIQEAIERHLTQEGSCLHDRAFREASKKAD
jgi:hypothetical protein